MTWSFNVRLEHEGWDKDRAELDILFVYSSCTPIVGG